MTSNVPNSSCANQMEQPNPDNKVWMRSSSLQRIVQRQWFYPVFLLLVMFITYDLQVFRLGFFWDDWQVVFLSRLNSAAAYWDHFAFDRPLSVWTYLLTVPLLGMRPILWHLLTLVLRWLSVLGFCWALRGLWPTRITHIHWMGLLMAVYPGFSQQPVSVAYSQHFISYALFTFSLGLMVWAIQQPQNYWRNTAAGVVFSLVQLMTMEYFFGLELVRPVMLWFLLHRKGEKLASTTGKVLRHWAPYLLPLAVFGLTRFIFVNQLFPHLEANPPLLLMRMRNQPFTELRNLLQIALQDSINVGLFAWLHPIQPESISLGSSTYLFSWLIGLLAAAAMGGYAWLNTPREAAVDEQEKPFLVQGAVLGLSAVLFSGLPIWTTDRMTTFNAWADRFSLPLMFGVVILVVCFIEWAMQKNNRKYVVFSILAGAAIAAHFRSIDQYRRHWQIQQTYYRQLVWRIPGLETGTAILAPELSFSYVGFYSPGYAINTIYSRDFSPEDLPIWWISASRYIGSNTLPSMQENVPILYTDRNLVFASNTSQALPVTFNHARGCLRVMDPIYRLAPRMSEFDDDLWALSGPQHMDRILPPGENDAVLPAEIFGRQPLEWCYYFEKADLARQFEDWQTVLDLAAEAEASGFGPQNGTEWIPFIEAYARLGQWDAAQEHTLAAAQLTAEMEPALCATWERIQAATDDSPARASALAALEPVLQCRSTTP